MSTAIRFAATVAAVVSFGIAGPAAARRYGERHQGTRRVALRGVDRRVDGPQHARQPGQLDRICGGLLSGRRREDRKSVVSGKSVSVRVALSGRRIINKIHQKNTHSTRTNK